MGQRSAGTALGIARSKRAHARKQAVESVRRKGRSECFRRSWIEPTVLYVVEGGDAWSAYLRRMTRRPGWSVARLARDSGIARSSIFKWIAEGAEAITIDSVNRIADALEDDRANALKAAGNLPPERDAEVDLILASDRPDSVKAELIERLMRRREEERQRRIADLEWMLGQTGETAS